MDREMEMNNIKEFNNGDNNNNSFSKKTLANHIYIFCPLFNKGILFFDQSPDGSLAKFSGSLPDGKFWSSGERTVEWDETINGIKDNSIPVSNEVSYIVNTIKQAYHNSDGSFDSYTSTTIIVSEANFYNFILQLENPTYNPDNNYKVLNLNSKVGFLNQNVNYNNVTKNLNSMISDKENNESNLNNFNNSKYDYNLNFVEKENEIPTNPFKH